MAAAGSADIKMEADKDVQFVTNKMCPFAQKVWVCLEEKKVVPVSRFPSSGETGEGIKAVEQEHGTRPHKSTHA